MKKILSIIALLLIVTGCSTVPESPQEQLSVLETWSGYAKGTGGDCSDAEVNVKVLEDLSITGYAYATEFNVIIKLKGNLSSHGKLYATGSGSGGVNVTYEGNVNGNFASGKWKSSFYSCYGTWELAKN